MPRNSTDPHHNQRPKWSTWLTLTVLVASLGTIGLSVTTEGTTRSPETQETTQSHSKGNGTVPWYYLTIYTIGVVFLSYYLGGVFNSQLGCSDDADSSTTLLRLRSQLTFLPISQFIRCHARRSQHLPLYSLGPSEGESTAVRISSQTESLIEAILQGYVFPWYNRISDEKTFPEHSKQILRFVFARLTERIQKVCFSFKQFRLCLLLPECRG